MKKKTILSALLLCLAATLHAQTPGNIIYLKNGSIIKGNVVESVPNQHIKIRTPTAVSLSTRCPMSTASS